MSQLAVLQSQVVNVDWDYVLDLLDQLRSYVPPYDPADELEAEEECIEMLQEEYIFEEDIPPDKLRRCIEEEMRRVYAEDVMVRKLEETEINIRSAMYLMREGKTLKAVKNVEHALDLLDDIVDEVRSYYESVKDEVSEEERRELHEIVREVSRIVEDIKDALKPLVSMVQS